MANELRHADAVDGKITESEYEAIGEHIFNSQATGDILIATSPTQLSRLGITNDRVLVSSGGLFSWSNTLPAFTVGDNNGIDIYSGADENHDLITVGVTNTPTFGWDEAGEKFTFVSQKGIQISGAAGPCVTIVTDGGLIRSGPNAADYVGIQAYDTGVGYVEVARIAGEADPYFQLGPTAGAFRVSLAKVIQIDLDGSLETVSLGVADSGGAGFMLLRIPNT